jgi:GlpG protein
MRTIGQLESEPQARMFADYLFVRGIEAMTEASAAGAWTIWVVDEDRVDESKALLSRFRSMPEAEEFYAAARAADARRREEQRASRSEEQKLTRPAAAVRRLGGGGITTVLMILCVATALVTRLGQERTWTEWFLISNLQLIDPARFWDSLAEIAQGQVWRLFSPVLLHFSLWHLVFNLLWMQDLGTVLEGRIGSWRFAGVVAFVAVVSNLAQYVAAGAGFGGLSGVVYGLFGYLWVRGRFDIRFGVWISPLTSGLLLVFLALGIFGLLGPTANAAHFSGLLAGAVLGWLAAGRARNVQA